MIVKVKLKEDTFLEENLYRHRGTREGNNDYYSGGGGRLGSKRRVQINPRSIVLCLTSKCSEPELKS